VPRRGVARRARQRKRRAHLRVRASSRRPEATPPEVGSTLRVAEVRAPPRGVLALAALRAQVCPPVRRRAPGAPVEDAPCSELRRGVPRSRGTIPFPTFKASRAVHLARTHHPPRRTPRCLPAP
jgi:hypothetical protein